MGVWGFGVFFVVVVGRGDFSAFADERRSKWEKNSQYEQKKEKAALNVELAQCTVQITPVQSL